MSLQAQYTSTTTAFRLTATPATGVALPETDPSKVGQRPVGAYLQATTQDIRFTADGVTTPTASVGALLVAGAEPWLYYGPLNQLQFIRATAGSILNVIYTDQPQAAIGAAGATGATGATGASGPVSVDDINTVLEPPSTALVLNNDPAFEYWYWGGVLTPSIAADAKILNMSAGHGDGTIALYGIAETNSGTNTNSRGAEISATNTSPDAASGSQTALFVSSNQIDGTMGTLRGILINNEVDSNVGSVRGIDINAMSYNSGTVTEAIGLLIQPVAGATTNYAIKTGAGKSVFGDFVVIQRHSAPADGDIAAGDMAIWFDQTNGAGKLMIKAKTANGTVATGSVALS